MGWLSKFITYDQESRDNLLVSCFYEQKSTGLIVLSYEGLLISADGYCGLLIFICLLITIGVSAVLFGNVRYLLTVVLS